MRDAAANYYVMCAGENMERCDRLSDICCAGRRAQMQERTRGSSVSPVGPRLASSKREQRTERNRIYEAFPNNNAQTTNTSGWRRTRIDEAVECTVHTHRYGSISFLFVDNLEFRCREIVVSGSSRSGLAASRLTLLFLVQCGMKAANTFCSRRTTCANLHLPLTADRLHADRSTLRRGTLFQRISVGVCASPMSHQLNN